MLFRVEVQTVEAADETERKRNWLLGMFFGLLGSLLIYNLFLAITLRDAGFIWYVLHLFFLTIYYLYVNNLLPAELAGSSAVEYRILTYLLHLNLTMVFVSMGLFARAFLTDKRTTPRLHRILTWQLALPTALAAIGAFNIALGMQANGLVGFLMSLLIMGCAAFRLSQGYKPAAVFLIGWLWYFVGGVMQALAWNNFIPATDITLSALQLGTAVEVLVMSMALVYRVRLLQKEKERAEASYETANKDKALLSLVLENSQLGIGLVKDNAVAWGNKRFLSVFGAENGLKLSEAARLDAVFSPPEPSPGHMFQERERAMDMPPYGYRHFRMLGRYVDNERREEGAVWVTEDVTKQVRLEMLKEDVDRIMRHDLVSPLTAMQLTADALLNADNLTDDQKRICRLTSDTTYQMLAQVNSYVAVYKMETGKYSARPEPVDLVTVLNQVKAELAPVMAAHGVAVTVKTDNDSFMALGQESLFHTMLVNLLKNAVEASPEDAEVEVALEDGSEKRLTIKNLGVVPIKIRDRFFDKFVTAGKPGGTGLGTYSAKLLAQSQGAEIVLDASDPETTTIAITFQSA